jgi:SAM-dependent methyltransferase
MKPSPEQLPGLFAGAFRKADTTPDAQFYVHPRFVNHIDDGAIAAVSAIYQTVLPADGDILDLMSSWVSHLPSEVSYRSVTGLGMNAEELAANPCLTAHVVQDLNANAELPFADRSFDGAGICASVQYLERPVDVFRQVHRVLRPGAPFVVSFSHRCFPTKAVAIWLALGGAEQQQLVGAYMKVAGFEKLGSRATVPPYGDPLWAVIGYAPLNSPP